MDSKVIQHSWWNTPLGNQVRKALKSAVEKHIVKPISVKKSVVSLPGKGSGSYEMARWETCPFPYFLLAVKKELSEKPNYVRNVDIFDIKELQDHTLAKDFKNPFLPFDPDLFIAPIGLDHSILLNKFNILDCHMLIITNAFEKQEQLIMKDDWAACWTVFEALEGNAFGFYNSGPFSGASQPHRHFQIIGLPIGEADLPLFGFVTNTLDDDCPNTPIIINELPFIHALCVIPESLREWKGHIESNELTEFIHSQHGGVLLDIYNELITSVAIQLNCAGHISKEFKEAVISMVKSGKEQTSVVPFSYNLLISKDWMILVPRQKETIQGVSVNSMGYAGSLYVKTEVECGVVKEVGIWAILKECGYLR